MKIVYDLETVPRAPTDEEMAEILDHPKFAVISDEDIHMQALAVSSKYKQPATIQKHYDATVSKLSDARIDIMMHRQEGAKQEWYEKNAFCAPLLKIVAFSLVGIQGDNIVDQLSASGEDCIQEFPKLFSSLCNHGGVKHGVPIMVGYNSTKFDMPVLKMNLVKNNLALTPRLSAKSWDNADIRYSLCGTKGTLKQVVQETFGAEYDEDENGSSVLGWYFKGDFDKIENYCNKDTLLTAKLYLRLCKVQSG